MSETKLVPIIECKKGSYIVIDGAACQTSDTQVSRPGKHGHAKVRLTASGLIDGKKRVIVLPGHDNVEVPMIDKRNAQVLSVNGDMANVMDSETYETFDLKIPSDLKGDIVDGVTVLYWVILADKIIKQIQKSD